MATNKHPDLDIDWTPVPLAEWEGRFARAGRAPLTQSYDYARAIASLEGCRPSWGIICAGAQEAGLVQILETRLFGGAIHTVQIDRGPLWFDGFNGAAYWAGFASHINARWPARFARRRRWIPECADGPAARALIARAGWQVAPGWQPYRTHWLDLAPGPSALRGGLHKNWRGALQKAERGHITVEWTWDGAGLAEFGPLYEADRRARGYPGARLKTLRALSRTFGPAQRFGTGIARANGEFVAGAVILLHGASATYQAGVTTPSGRDASATHLLLWSAIEKLASSGIHHLDLGGVNDHAPGLAQFKAGLGGEEVIYVQAHS